MITSVGARPWRVPAVSRFWALAWSDHEDEGKPEGMTVEWGCSGPLREQSMLPRRHLPSLNCERQAVLLSGSRTRGKRCERARWIDTSVEINGDSTIILWSSNREKTTAPIALATRRCVREHPTNSEPSLLGVPSNSYVSTSVALVSEVECGQANRMVPPSEVSSISPSAFSA